MSVKGPYHHVHLVTDDPRAIADWYVRNLDGRISQEVNVRGSMMVRLQLGEALLNIRAPRPGETIVAPREGSLIAITSPFRWTKSSKWRPNSKKMA
jgi:hypothetical protein